MAEITVDEDLVYVPHWWVCTECDYRTHRISYPEARYRYCPNDKAPIRRLTWKHLSDDLDKAGRGYAKQIGELIEENRALIARNREYAA